MREIGVVRKVLDGEEAAPYIGFARLVLGQLKNQMSFNKLQQGAWTRQLPDGTTVSVQSIFGQDSIMITKPAPSVESQPVEEFVSASLPEEGFGEAAVVAPDVTGSGGEITGCGYYYVRNTSGSLSPRPYRWTASQGLENLPVIGLYGQAKAVSGNGLVIVGTTYGEDGENIAVKWVGGEVFEICRTAVAFGASEDGSEIGIVATGEFSIARWTPGGLLSVSAVADAGFGPAMSRDGNYICATLGSYPNQRGQVWDRSGLTYAAPVAGYYARAVSDTGVVVLMKTAGDLYLWDLKTGALEAFGGMLEALAITPDGNFLVGRGWENSNSGVYRDNRSGEIFVLEPGEQTYVHSSLACVDAIGERVVMGGSAALEGKTNNHAPTGNDAVWTLENGVVTLNRIAPAPDADQGDGGLMTSITIPRTKLAITDGGMTTEITGTTVSILPA